MRLALPTALILFALAGCTQPNTRIVVQTGGFIDFDSALSQLFANLYATLAAVNQALYLDEAELVRQPGQAITVGRAPTFRLDAQNAAYRVVAWAAWVGEIQPALADADWATIATSAKQDWNEWLEDAAAETAERHYRFYLARCDDSGSVVEVDLSTRRIASEEPCVQVCFERIGGVGEAFSAADARPGAP